MYNNFTCARAHHAMKINDFPFQLQAIFNRHLNTLPSTEYDYTEPQVGQHIRLSQDLSARYYFNKSADMIVFSPKDRQQYEQTLNWQILQSYRILNTAYASCVVQESVKNDLVVLKEVLEKTDYLRQLLSDIAQGLIRPNLVCSGHGGYHVDDGFINMMLFDATVMVVSGLGASLQEGLGTGLENDQLDLDELVVVDQKKQVVSLSKIDTYPTMFSKSRNKSVPNFRLADSSSLPKPRVIEPLTGRVLLDSHSLALGKKYFSLFDILRKFGDKKRSITWAACTGVRDCHNKKTGDFLGYSWTDKKSLKRVLENESEEEDKKQCRVKSFS